MKNLILLGVAAVGGAVLAADNVIPDNIEIAGGEVLEIAVGSGDTSTYSGVISGAGSIKKTGAGTLVLSGENTFSGGFTFGEGKVRVDNSSAFGASAVTNTATTSGSQIIFNCADGTFDNDFLLLGSTSGSGDYPLLQFDKNTTINGNLTLTKESNIGNSKGASPVVTFNGNVLGGQSIIYKTYGNSHFRAPLKIFKLYPGNVDSASGYVHLYSPDNRISGSIILRKGSVKCHGENVLGGAPLSMRSSIGGTSNTFIDLNGYNQCVKYITSEASSSPSLTATGGKIKSADPAVLTITGLAANSTSTSYYGVDGNVSVVLDVPETSCQRFDRRTSATIGSLEVKSGTLEILGTATFRNVTSVAVREKGIFLANSTENNALQGLERLTVEGKFSVGNDAANPFGSNLNVDLGDGAELVLPKDMILVVKSLSTNGVPIVDRMRIKAGEIPQIKSGALLVEYADTENVWVGGDADDAICRFSNWKNPGGIDLTGSMNATFAASDAVGFTARVDEDADFRHVILSAADGFRFAGRGSISVATGIVALAESGTAPVYSFKNPVRLGNSQFLTESYFPLSVASGARLWLEGDSVSSVDVKKTGVGTLDISGSNVWSGAFVVADGNVNISGTITTPEGVDENTSVERYGAGVLSFNMSPDRGASANRYLTVSNAVIEKPIWFAMGESSSTPYFNFPAGTTNIFKAYFCNDNQANQRFRTQGKDTVVSLEGGAKFPWNFQLTGLGTVFFRNKTVSNTGGSDGLVVQGNEYGSPTAVFEVPGNSLKNLTTKGEGGTIDIRVDNALGSSTTLNMYGAHERTKQGSVLLLNGTSQTIGCLKATAAVNAYSRIEGNGATLSIVNSSASSASSCRFRFVGDVSLDFDSPGTMLLTNAVSSSCGKIGVKRGTVTFAHDAAWTNASKVAVSGTGSIVINANDGFRSRPAFGRRVTLDFADEGKLKVPDGATMRVKYLYIDGVRMPSGFYGYSCSSDENIRKHFAESTGVIHAASGNGLTVTIR